MCIRDSPMSLLLGAAAQLGIFLAFIIALLLGFTPAEAGSIAVSYTHLEKEGTGRGDRE